jgi:hypothetical protein
MIPLFRRRPQPQPELLFHAVPFIPLQPVTSRPDKYAQFSEEQLRSLARRRCPADRVEEITNATRADLVVLLESVGVGS